MREIKFRAQARTGTWLYGGGVIERDGKFIMLHFDANGLVALTVIDPKSVGQYTGLKDKNGVEIYEGDVLKTTVGKNEWHYLIRRYTEFDCNLYGDTIYRNFKSTDDGLYEWGDFYMNEPSRKSLHGARNSLEVIGNIYENSELLHK